MTTALAEDELLTEVRLPLLPADTRFGFQEFARRAGDFALGMALVTYRLDGKTIVEPRVGIGAAEATAAPHPRGRGGVDGQGTRRRTRSAPPPRRPRPPSIRLRITIRTPIIGATWCVRSRAVRSNAPAA